MRETNGLGRKSFKWQNTSTLKPAERQFNNICYGFYIFFAIIMFIFIMRDWKSDILDILKADKLRNAVQITRKPKSATTDNGNSSDRKSCFGDVLRVILSNWMEVALIIFMVILMVAREQFLWIGMLILLCLLVARECFQLMVSVRRYILSPENWIEVSMIILVCILLFHNDTKEGIELKRHMAAFAIVLSWTELITLFGKHPKLSR